MRFALVLVALLLASCQSAPRNVYAARASYDASVLAPAAHYSQLPTCPAAPICKDPAVVVQLQKADQAALAALDAAEELVRNHPQVDATAAIDAANQAIAAAIKIITTYGVK